MTDCSECNDTGISSLDAENHVMFFGPCRHCNLGLLVQRMELIADLQNEEIQSCDSLEELQCLIKEKINSGDIPAKDQYIHHRPPDFQ